MDSLQPFIPVAELLLSKLNLLLLLGAALLGSFLGAMPGIRAIHAVTLVLPLGYALKWPLTTTLIVLLTLYYACEYGSRIERILELPQEQRETKLLLSGLAAFVGGSLAVGGLLLIFTLLRLVPVRLGPADYVALICFAFAALSFRSDQPPLKTLASTCLGLVLATVGIDSTTGIMRFTFDRAEIYDGIEFTTVAVGVFIFSEIFSLLLLPQKKQPTGLNRNNLHVDWSQLNSHRWLLLRNSLIGFVVGILPGNGTVTASNLSDSLEQRLQSKASSTTRTTDLPLHLARECSRNAATGGTMVPLLALGIPGSGTSAILLGALLLYNVTPGPTLLTQHSEIIISLILASLFANLCLLLINSKMLPLLSRAYRIPAYIQLSTLLVLAFVAVFSVHGNHLSILIALVIGLFSYLLQQLNYPLAPLLLGFVLGSSLEDNLRRALATSGGDSAILWSGPVSQLFWLLTLLILLFQLCRWLWKKVRR